MARIGALEAVPGGAAHETAGALARERAALTQAIARALPKASEVTARQTMVADRLAEMASQGMADAQQAVRALNSSRRGCTETISCIAYSPKGLSP